MGQKYTFLKLANALLLGIFVSSFEKYTCIVIKIYLIFPRFEKSVGNRAKKINVATVSYRSINILC